jgi:CRISPR/Cas system-associated protein Cas10 (large subunit of type III CRISPR-Cas system)
MQCSQCRSTVVPKLYKIGVLLLCEDCKIEQKNEASEEENEEENAISEEETEVLHRCDVCGELEAFYEYARDEDHLMLICYECAAFFPPTRMSIRQLVHTE